MSVPQDSHGPESGPYFIQDGISDVRGGYYPVPAMHCTLCRCGMYPKFVAPVGGLSSLVWVLTCVGCGRDETWASTNYPSPDQ